MEAASHNSPTVLSYGKGVVLVMSKLETGAYLPNHRASSLVAIIGRFSASDEKNYEQVGS